MADSLRISLAERDAEQAITALKKGSYLLKYGRRGKPKFCPFHVSSDESALVWYSGKEEKQVNLSQVLRIVPGQRTATFRRYPRPEKEYQSFSLICADRSLDLISKDKDEAEVWFVGLKALITRGKVGKFRNTIKSDIASEESPRTLAQKISPFVTALDQVIQPPPEAPAQNRLGKVFSDIVTLTAPANNNPTEAVFTPFSPLLPIVENSDPRTSASEPVRVSLSSIVSSSSHGSFHEDFDSLGDIFIWGEGISDGVLSGTSKSVSSTTEDALLPKKLESTIVLDVHSIACGTRHAALVTKQGEIFSWGNGTGGKLGHGLEEDTLQPKLISSLRGMSVESVACGEFHTCALTLSGDLYTWGDGSRYADMLGHGSEASYWWPKRVSSVLEGMHVSYVACGPWHTAVVTSSGQLFTFGDGSFGVLGHGDRCSTSLPREVETLRGSRVTKIACGVWHMAAVVEVITSSSSNGQLFTWGDGEKGQLGHGDNDSRLMPLSVDTLKSENICQVACGDSLTVALTAKGIVYTMGSKAYGQLGNPNADGKVPTRVEGDIAESPVEEIACGSYHVAVLTSKSEVYTWGKGSNGQLGHGKAKNGSEPEVVGFLKDKQVKAITCGSNFSAVICIHRWLPGSEHSVCAGCRNPFNFRRKRHNCYNCGLVFCRVCSSRKSLRAALAPDMNKPYRVCFGCFTKLKKSMDPPHLSASPGTKFRNGYKRMSSEEAVGPKHPSAITRISSVDSIVHGEERPPRNSRSLFLSASGNGHLVGSPLPKGSTCLDNLAASPRRSSELSPSEESKHIKDNVDQEIVSLREQVEQLTSRTQQLEEELDKARKQLKVVTAMAADEAEECKTAKDQIKSLATQVKEMSERDAHKAGSSSSSNNTNPKRKVKEKTESRTQSHVRTMDGHENESLVDNGSKTERVVQDEPGVYLTLISLPNGGNELKRVRFSRKRFTEEQAEKWWGENGSNACERHNIVVS